MSALADWVWYTDGGGAAVIRAVLTPLSHLFGWAVARRNARFDRLAEATGPDALPSMPLPAISIGNLTVGGTGKTPVASWFVSRLLARGAHPALVLRGYGDDEWRVHLMLTPDAPVITDADRVRGAQTAVSRGADCVVLDDAFQHRHARRVSDVVLVSADQWHPAVRLLPAGPYREGLAALDRATAVVITVKAATEEKTAAVLAALSRVVPAERIAVVRLLPGGLRGWPQGDGPALQGLTATLMSAIADPQAFERQLGASGLTVRGHLRFPDHHQFTAEEVSKAVTVAQGGDGVVCTLKDAVKLGPLWPRFGPPLWYLSQTVVVDRGAEVLEEQCDRVLAARRTTVPTAG